jgi:hypothetical protein
MSFKRKYFCKILLSLNLAAFRFTVVYRPVVVRQY